MINSRNLDDLLPKVKELAEQFIAKCKEVGIDIAITSTYRDFECQDALYAQGRTKPGPEVTKAKGGESYHNFRVAFDFVPIVDNKAIWNDFELFEKCAQIGESLGLKSGRSWGDLPHLQFTNGLSLADFRAGKTF